MISRRTGVAVAAVVVLGGALGGLAWRYRGAPDRAQPPVIDLAGENDPALERAVEDARSKVLRQPGSAEAWGWLGKVLLANGIGEDSLVCFAEASRLAPAEPRWPYLRGLAQQAISPDAAVPFFQEAVRRLAGEGPAADVVRLHCAEALMRKGETAEAKGLLQEVLRHDPDNPRALLAAGMLAERANDLEAARSYLVRCLGRPLARQRAATRLAALSLRKGDPAAAERYRQQARRFPRDAEGPDPYADEYKALLVGRRARLLRAQGLIRAGAIQEAVELLQPMVNADDAELEAYVKLGMALALLGKYREAEAVLRRGLARGQDQAQGHYFLCVAVFHQAERQGARGRAGFEEAAAQARLALARKPDHAFARLYLGLALDKLGKPSEALAELEQAARISPESTDPQLHLGEALLARGQQQRGYAHLEKAIELAGDSDPRPRKALTKWREQTGGK